MKRPQYKTRSVCINFIQTIGQVYFIKRDFSIFPWFPQNPDNYLETRYQRTETRGNLVFSHYAMLFICYLDEYVKRPETDGLISNWFKYCNSALRKLTCTKCVVLRQAFFIDENTLFIIKSSMGNQFWASISLLLRLKNKSSWKIEGTSQDR